MFSGRDKGIISKAKARYPLYAGRRHWHQHRLVLRVPPEGSFTPGRRRVPAHVPRGIRRRAAPPAPAAVVLGGQHGRRDGRLAALQQPPGILAGTAGQNFFGLGGEVFFFPYLWCCCVVSIVLLFSLPLFRNLVGEPLFNSLQAFWPKGQLLRPHGTKPCNGSDNGNLSPVSCLGTSFAFVLFSHTDFSDFVVICCLAALQQPPGILAKFAG